MGTRGFIGIRHNDKTTITYNHYDSYPTGLGVDAANFIRTADLAQVAEGFAALVPVEESEHPTPEQLADLKERGFWRDVSIGYDWYSALRDAQGDLGRYLQAGYIPEMDAAVIQGGDCFIEYGYLIDLDQHELVVYAYDREGVPMRVLGRFAIDRIRGEGFDAEAAMKALEN